MSVKHVGRIGMPVHRGDVGYDLFVEIERPSRLWRAWRAVTILAGDRWFVGAPFVVLWPFQMKNMATGVRLDMRESNWWAKIELRSSAAKRGLTMIGGVIDEGYTGPLYTYIRNMNLWPVVIRQGDRLCQVVFHSRATPPLWRVPCIKPRDGWRRNDDGFGSTGIGA